jgi:hypothetical protein
LPNDPDQLIIYSLDPAKTVWGDEKAKAKMEGEYLTRNAASYRVLGRVQVTDRGQEREVLSAIRRAVNTPVTQFNCWDPRHAIRVVKGSETLDMIICFECHNYDILRNGDPNSGGLTPAISSDPEPLLDKILSDAGIPLAEKARK